MVAQVSVNLRHLVTCVTSRRSGLATHKAHCISVTKVKQLMSLWGIFADYRKDHIKQVHRVGKVQGF